MMSGFERVGIIFARVVTSNVLPRPPVDPSTSRASTFGQASHRISSVSFHVNARITGTGAVATDASSSSPLVRREQGFSLLGLATVPLNQ